MKYQREMGSKIVAIATICLVVSLIFLHVCWVKFGLKTEKIIFWHHGDLVYFVRDLYTM